MYYVGVDIAKRSHYAAAHDESGAVVERSFGGSLPAFIAAFTKGKTLSDREADEIQRLIDKSRQKKERD